MRETFLFNLLVFMCSCNFMFILVEHENSSITSESRNQLLFR